jgi:hypothetical protein
MLYAMSDIQTCLERTTIIKIHNLEKIKPYISSGLLTLSHFNSSMLSIQASSTQQSPSVSMPPSNISLIGSLRAILSD